MTTPLVSIVASDLSYNTVGRAYMIGKCLETEFDIEIIGPKYMNDEIWEPVRDEFEYKEVDGRLIPLFAKTCLELVRAIEGDLVYVVTPRLQNFLPGIIASRQNDLPLMLDIVDWESSFTREFSYPLLDAVRLWNPNSISYILLVEQLIGFADEKTVVSSFLQKKFGGTILPQARDTTKMDPALFDGDELREQYDVPLDDEVILFLGTPRKHKGLLQLVEAVNRIDVPNKRLMIVGASDTPLLDEVRRVDNGNVLVFGKQPFSKIPEFHAIADVVAVPQQPSLPAKAQVPAKIIDAMAMGNPIVSTDLSDIPSVVGDGGVIVPPNDVKALADALQELLANEPKREAMGCRARRRCVERYSYDAARSILRPLIERLLDDMDNCPGLADERRG